MIPSPSLVMVRPPRPRAVPEQRVACVSVACFVPHLLVAPALGVLEPGNLTVIRLACEALALLGIVGREAQEEVSFWCSCLHQGDHR